MKNEDTTGGTFKVEAWVVQDGEELYRGNDEYFIDAGKSYKFDLSPGGLPQNINQKNLQHRVRPPAWVIGPEITCPVCGGVGKE